MLLRDVTEDDLPIFYEHQREPEACRIMGRTPRELEPFLRHWRERVLPDAAAGKKTIVVAGEVVGNVVSWNDVDGKRLVGYWLGQAHWGRGIATAALTELVREHETARPLHAYVALGNVASMRVLEKCGFSRVGTSGVGPDGVEEMLFRLG